MPERLPNLHDANLQSVRLDWADGQCEIAFDGGPAFPGLFSLVWDDVQEIAVPRKYPWGESVSVLSAEYREPSRYEFQMQSGDLIVVVAPNYSVKWTAAASPR